MGLTTTELGRTGMEITRVGFGAWAVGGGGVNFGWGSQDDEDSIRAIRHAVDVGVNWVDTAAVYGHGHSEQVVGRAVRGIAEADRPFVFTKCGLNWDDDDPMGPHPRDLRPGEIRRGAEDSLRRLGLERIDLLQFHWPDAGGPEIENSWAEMGRLIDEGKVRAGGVSNFDVPLLERAEAVRPVASLQPPFSLIRRGAAGDVIPWCHQHHVGIIVYSPMQSGLLSGRFSAERVASLPADDWRRANAEFQSPALGRNLALASGLRPISARHRVSIAEVAIAWTLSWPGVTGAIVGARSPEQVDGWIGAAALTLTADDLAEIAVAVESSEAGGGPSRPPLD
jgi:aryl-alcohol dehydrogenase-like predicted oxidoreductase